MKPILFNTAMVKAILDGRKSTTRRLIKFDVKSPADEFDIEAGDVVHHNGKLYRMREPKGMAKLSGDLYAEEISAPYKEGDILYVRETWKCAVTGTAGPGLIDTYLYRADCKEVPKGCDAEPRWRPSIHMPKTAARLFLKVTGVKIGHLQDMEEEDAFAEGYQEHAPWCYHRVFENYPDSPIPCYASDGGECPAFDRPCDKSIPELFGEEIWDTTVPKKDLDKYGWKANPLVWVIDFKRIDRKGEAWNDKP